MTQVGKSNEEEVTHDTDMTATENNSIT